MPATVNFPSYHDRSIRKSSAFKDAEIEILENEIKRMDELISVAMKHLEQGHSVRLIDRDGKALTVQKIEEE